MAQGKRWEPTEAEREIIKALASFGVPRDRIAPYVGVHEDTLRKHCRAELESADVGADLAVLRNLHRLASTSDNPTAAIFWCKTRLRWRETDKPEDKPTEDTPGVDRPKTETVDEWRARRERESK